MKNQAIIGAVGLALGLVLGYFAGVWIDGLGDEERQLAAAETAAALAEAHEAEVRRLNHQLDLDQLHLRLGRIALEADRQDYGTAGDRATRFFDEVAQTVEQGQAEGKARADLQRVLAARDDLIAGLATAQPSATVKLKQLFLGLFATEGAGSAQPGAGAAGATGGAPPTN